MLGEGTTCHPPPASETGVPFTGFPVAEAVSLPSGAGANGGGSGGGGPGPGGWDNGALGCAGPPARRAPPPDPRPGRAGHQEGADEPLSATPPRRGFR